MLRLADTCHAEGVATVATDVLERGVLLAVREVHKGAHAELWQVHGGRAVRDTDELLGVRIIQRLQKHAIHHAEHHSVGADADGQRNQRDGGEQRGPRQPAQDLFELIVENCHDETSSSAAFGIGPPGARIQKPIEQLYATGFSPVRRKSDGTAPVMPSASYGVEKGIIATSSFTPDQISLTISRGILVLAQTDKFGMP